MIPAGVHQATVDERGRLKLPVALSEIREWYVASAGASAIVLRPGSGEGQRVEVVHSRIQLPPELSARLRGKMVRLVPGRDQVEVLSDEEFQRRIQAALNGKDMQVFGSG